MSALLAAVMAMPALGQNTGGVSGPVVTEGAAALGYRVAHDPDAGSFAHRFYTERALTGGIKLRGTVQARQPDGTGLDFDYARAELTWQATPDSSIWQSGFRFDARIRSEGRPGEVAVHWLNEVRVSEATRLRLSALASRDIGVDADSDVRLATRGDIDHALGGGHSLGLSLFSRYGPAMDPADWHNQSHQLGPAWRFRPEGSRISLEAGALFGLTEATPDAEFRLFLTRAF